MKEHWNERYSASEYIYGTEPNAWLAEKLALLQPGKILFPAEGEGRNAVFAASLGWNVHAFDQSEEGMKKALRLASEKGVSIQYSLGDLTDYNAEPRKFDAIALIFVHTPIEIRQAVHQRLLSFLKPGGHLILEAFTKQQIKNTSGGPRTELLLYEPAYIAEDFKTLEFIEFSEATTVLDEGPLHQGEAFVIRLFATKPHISQNSAE
jgi:2-polyprenyl-3-methyl-5-hydroxy-6-metoxy-1,4-benzoquinol methylase